MVETCNKYGIFLKQHNTDYLSNETLKWLPRLGIHAVNVAPEFGYIESLEYSKSIKSILKYNSLKLLNTKLHSLWRLQSGQQLRHSITLTNGRIEIIQINNAH